MEKNIHENPASLWTDVFNGKQVNDKSGRWHLFNGNSPTMLELSFDEGNAIYGFEIINKPETIELINYHREARTGYGSESIQNLKKIWSEVSRKLNKTIKIIFLMPTSGQSDTVN